MQNQANSALNKKLPKNEISESWKFQEVNDTIKPQYVIRNIMYCILGWVFASPIMPDFSNKQVHLLLDWICIILTDSVTMCKLYVCVFSVKQKYEHVYASVTTA